MANKKNKNENKNEVILEQAPEAVETAKEAGGKDEAVGEADGGKDVVLTQDEFLKVKEHIAQIQKEKEEAVALAQRIQADFDNYRRRNATLKKDSYDEGTRDCMRAILPSLDNLDRALSNAKGVSAAYIDGIKLVQKTLLTALGKLGLKEIETGNGFDANLHDAVMQEVAEGREPGEILEVLQKGYEAEGKILRHSMVKVAQ